VWTVMCQERSSTALSGFPGHRADSGRAAPADLPVRYEAAAAAEAEGHTATSASDPGAEGSAHSTAETQRPAAGADGAAGAQNGTPAAQPAQNGQLRAGAAPARGAVDAQQAQQGAASAGDKRAPAGPRAHANS
jgi:hypothetical protein